MRLVLLVALMVFAVDQALKWWIVVGLDLINRGVIEVWPPYLTLRMAWNRGINFGLLSGEADWVRWGLVAVALAITLWVWTWVRKPGQGRLARLSAGLLIGGALGNVVDRIVWGAVADFLNMSCCGIENPYAFNLADIAIFAGAIGLVLFAAEPGRGRRKTP
jgi:signal peptidase II